MKRITAILFLVVFITTTFLQAVIVMHYYINYNNYVNELCINKDNKQLQCNGNCQLTKELKAISPKNNNNQSLPIESVNEFLSPFIQNISKTDIKKNSILYTVQNTQYNFFEFQKVIIVKDPRPPEFVA